MGQGRARTMGAKALFTHRTKVFADGTIRKIHARPQETCLCLGWQPVKHKRSLFCRKAGISQATYFNWKKKYDGLLPHEMRRLKQLEDENAKLKKLVADLSLDREMLQDVIRRKL